MRVSQIAAMAENRVIGVNNSLPWHLPEDLKFFKEKTLGRVLIMGRKTFESLGSKALPKRFTIVVTRDTQLKVPENSQLAHSVEEALKIAKGLTSKWGDEVFICGGGEIYKESLSYADRIYLTIIRRNVEGDARFPEIPAQDFIETRREERDSPEPFTFLTYDRKPLAFMRRAILLSEIKMRENHGGPFGAVIVKDGRIVGEGWNKVFTLKDPTAHAEVEAIRDACRRLSTFELKGCEIYTSCEPCPMCLAAIYWARIDKIYFGNTRADAARIQFDDEFIYSEIGRAIEERKIPGTPLLREEAQAAFKEWVAKVDKISY